jgi:hypothetical protein
MIGAPPHISKFSLVFKKLTGHREVPNEEQVPYVDVSFAPNLIDCARRSLRQPALNFERCMRMGRRGTHNFVRREKWLIIGFPHSVAQSSGQYESIFAALHLCETVSGSIADRVRSASVSSHMWPLTNSFNSVKTKGFIGSKNGIHPMSNTRVNKVIFP